MDQLLQTKDAARRLNCSVELVRALARSGVLPSMQTPTGLRVYLASDVEKLAVKRKNERQQRAQQAEGSNE